MKKNTLILSLLALSLTTFWNCGGDDTTNPPPVPTYAVKVTVNGITGTLVLRNNGGDDLTAEEDGEYEFDTKIEDGEDYNVTPFDIPPGQACSVVNGTGTIDGEDAAVVVNCS